MVIMIRDHVSGCNTNQEGEVIYNLIAPKIEHGQTVTISFKGITSVSTSFLNTAIAPLLEVVSFDSIKRQLKVVESTRFINSMIVKRLNDEITLVRN
ncbi:STAS-like domain-containing protein [Paenibacillus sp. MAH-36]|uniref:STAS-like domain-containing protein n=1 Tax=Paenibacillus violae TaxID=3077234 RepID=A0ABU3R7D7_9BACL|nr:STAS-like domain-containing protein [Paenibacillus sp. PFR10]MDU0200180.1 STAS-like domain-containing protein [Paenibacillus sp. PFR10]